MDLTPLVSIGASIIHIFCLLDSPHAFEWIRDMSHPGFPALSRPPLLMNRVGTLTPIKADRAGNARPEKQDI